MHYLSFNPHYSLTRYHYYPDLTDEEMDSEGLSDLTKAGPLSSRFQNSPMKQAGRIMITISQMRSLRHRKEGPSPL